MTIDGGYRKAEGGLRTRVRYKRPMTGKPLITVITVVYNGADYLRQTIESVIHQQYDNLEYIIIDGGSTDGTLELVKSFDDAVDYWVSEPDCGIYDAMNKGIACSTGKYLLFLNARDELAVELADIGSAFEGDNVLIYGKANMLEDDRTLVYVKGKRLKGSRKLITGTPLCHQAIFYKRDAVGRYNLDYKIIADRVLTYEMIEKYGIEQTLFIDRPIANYFEGGFSRQNCERWRNDEITFLHQNGNYLYAAFRRLGYWYKKYLAIIVEVPIIRDLLRLKRKL